MPYIASQLGAKWAIRHALLVVNQELAKEYAYFYYLHNNSRVISYKSEAIFWLRSFSLPDHSRKTNIT